jgi:hypothetical protein
MAQTELEDLSPSQKEYLHLAYVLQKANGCVDARGRESSSFKSGMRRLVKFALATERFSGVFDLTVLGSRIGADIEAQRAEAKRKRIEARAKESI